MATDKEVKSTDGRKLTPGEAKRQQQERDNKQAIQKQKQQSTVTHFTKEAENECLGAYKRTVIDSFVGVFTERYGDSFDYNTLVKSLKFSIKQDKNGLHPDFSFKSDKIDFRGDVKKECREFNENTKENFISNDDVISGNIDMREEFNTHDEFQAYEEGEINYSEIEKLDGQFIPTTNAERYSELNKINKTGGYEPVEQAGKDATQESNKVWDKAKTKVLSTLIKKQKL